MTLAAKIRELLCELSVGSMYDIHSMFKGTISEFLENGLEAELDDELNCSRYDCKNKNTNNSRNGHSSKTLLPATAISISLYHGTGKANSRRRS